MQRVLSLALAIYFLADYFFPRWGGPWKMVVPVWLGTATVILWIRHRQERDAPATLDIQRDRRGDDKATTLDLNS